MKLSDDIAPKRWLFWGCFLLYDPIIITMQYDLNANFGIAFSPMHLS